MESNSSLDKGILGRLTTLLDTIPDTIYFKDEKSVFTQINRAAAQHFGLNHPNEAIGKTDFDFFAIEHAQDAFADEQEIIRTGRPLIGKVEMETLPDGRVSFVSTTKMPLYDDLGKIIGTFGISRDITHQRDLEEEITKIADREKERIGADLHDELSQSLVALTLLANSLRDSLAKKGLPEADDAKQILEVSTEVNAIARSLARGLAPLRFVEGGFMLALQDLALRVAKVYKIKCFFEADTPVFFRDNVTATHFYRVIQQAVNNAAKHSKANFVSIRLTRSDEHVSAIVEDNGLGCSKDVLRTGGMGIQIMQYRSRLIGAALKIEPREQGGTIMTCSLTDSTLHR